MTKPTEITGYMKLHLWVSAPDHDDMDLAIKVEKLSKDGKPFFDPDRSNYRRYRIYAGIHAPARHTANHRSGTILHITTETKTETRRNRSVGN